MNIANQEKKLKNKLRVDAERASIVTTEGGRVRCIQDISKGGVDTLRIEYVSELLNKRFSSEEELKKAELAYKKQKADREKLQQGREARAKEVTDAFKKANELLDTFVKDYGSFHTSIHNTDGLLDLLFKTIF